VVAGEVIDAELLHRLLTAEGPVTCQTLGVSRAQLGSLEAAGCVLRDHPRQGVRLVRTGLGCWADYIEARHAGRIGRKVSVYRETTSTQDAARAVMQRGAAGHDGHVIVADHQTGGRGRLGRRWQAPPGASLLMTAIVDSPATVDRLMLAAACAVSETVEAVCEVQTRIRWPNDVLIDQRKLAGILVETVGSAAMIGIGINVSAHPDDLPATSLHAESIHVDRLHVLDLLLDRLDFDIHHATADQLLRCWRKRSCLAQQRVTVTCDGRELTGRVIDLDPADGLLMQVEHGPIVTLPAATTSLVV